MKQHSQLPRRDLIKLALLASAGGVMAGSTSPQAQASKAAVAARPFFHPHRIRYDGLSLFVENKPFFLYSGCFHYYRCPKAMWRNRFEKIKEAGFNTVQTYIPWNISERQKPASLKDFSHVDLTDLDEWLQMATEEFGLYVTIRPGPYICAEWDTGGFPQWLITYKPKRYRGEWLRSDDSLFMAWSRHWYDAVCPVIAKHQLSRKPVGKAGVFLFQVENEYDYPPFPVEVKRRYVESLVEGALANGIDVPLFINWGRCVLGAKNSLLHRVFDTMDFYPRANVNSAQGSIDAMRRSQPDAPLMTAELQGGWFTGVGGVPDLRTSIDHYGHGIGPEQINNLTLFCMQNGVTMINYYMLFGGTNFGGHPGRGIATSYDYSAPIRENGGVGAKYLSVKALASMLRDHGPNIARSKVVKVSARTGHTDVSMAARESPDGGIYVFIRKNRDGRERRGRVKLTCGRLANIEFAYSLGHFGSKILYFPPGVNSAHGAKWLPAEQSAPARPSQNLPAAIPITECRTAVDPLPTNWRHVEAGQTLADLGFYESGFNYYRASVNAQPKPAHVPRTLVEAKVASGDSATAIIDGRLYYPASSGGTDVHFSPKSELEVGKHTALLVYENRGHANGGMSMEETYGISRLSIVPTNLVGQAIDKWSMRHIEAPKNPRSVALTHRHIDTTGWRNVVCKTADSATQLTPNSWGVFRCKIDVTSNEIKNHTTTLWFSRIDDNGWVFVNGQFIGHSTAWGRPWTFDAAHALRAGKNSIAVIVQNIGGAGGMGNAKLITSRDMKPLSHLDGPMEIAAAPVGIERRWHEIDFDDRHWSSHVLPKPFDGSAEPHLLSWHRMEFKLPSVPADMWLPWCLKIQATGTGFIYVNGQNYGRFWQDGGQREYYLPECWLRPHGAGKNVIAVCLRAVNKPAQILSASVEPYTIYAEYQRKY